MILFGLKGEQSICCCGLSSNHCATSGAAGWAQARLSSQAGLCTSSEHPRFIQAVQLSLPSSLDCPSLILSLTAGASRRLTKKPDWSYRHVCVRGGKEQIVLETMSLFRALAPGRSNQSSLGGSAWQQLCLILPKLGQICGLLSCDVTGDASAACWGAPMLVVALEEASREGQVMCLHGQAGVLGRGGSCS